MTPEQHIYTAAVSAGISQHVASQMAAGIGPAGSSCVCGCGLLLKVEPRQRLDYWQPAAADRQAS